METNKIWSAVHLQVWDGRKKQSTHIFQNNYQVTSCTFNDTAEQVISGGLDNDIKVSTRVYILYRKGNSGMVTDIPNIRKL